MLKLTTIQLGNEEISIPVEVLAHIDHAIHDTYDDNLFHALQNVIESSDGQTIHAEICQQWQDQEHLEDVYIINTIFRILTAVAEKRLNLLNSLVNA